MLLEKWTTLRIEQVHLLAQELASRNLPVIDQFEPVADMEELLAFTEANPTPTIFMPQYPAWRLESVASRVIEAVAIAAHEPLTEFGYRELARILLEHTVYLYAYPHGDPRPRLEAGSALALAGCICASLPQSELWRFAGFGRISAVLSEVALTPTDSHLTGPIDAAFSLANEQDLPILASVIETYRTVLKRNIKFKNQFNLPLNDSDFFDMLNLDFPGLEAVKTAILSGDIDTAKSAYTDFVVQTCNPDSTVSDYIAAKTYLECLLRLSIHPTPAIIATTEIGIAACLFPEFRWSEHFHKLALHRYQWIAEAFFHTDGFHKDRTLRAQVEAIAHFARFISVHAEMAVHPEMAVRAETAARVNDFEEIQTFLEKLVATCIHLSKPDYTFPALGRLPAPDFDAIELCEIVDSDFSIENFPYPDTTSYALPQTGCYVMRDGWEEDAQYLFFDAQPPTAPNNPDPSHLVLYAHGRQLTTSSVRVVDTELSVSDVLDPRWLTAPAFDFVETWYQNSSVHYKRFIFYLKGEYFILHDLHLGGEARTVEQVFHLNGGANAAAERAWTQDTHLFISATGTTDITGALDDGAVTYRCTSEPPIALNTLLFPMRPGIPGHPRISVLTVETDTDVLATGFTLELSDTIDLFLISDDGLVEMSAADITFVGECLFLRRDASGSVSQYIILNGRFLQVGSQVLVDLDEPCESYVQV